MKMKTLEGDQYGKEKRNKIPINNWTLKDYKNKFQLSLYMREI